MLGRGRGAYMACVPPHVARHRPPSTSTGTHSRGRLRGPAVWCPCCSFLTFFSWAGKAMRLRALPACRCGAVAAGSRQQQTGLRRRARCVDTAVVVGATLWVAQRRCCQGRLCGFVRRVVTALANWGSFLTKNQGGYGEHKRECVPIRMVWRSRMCCQRPLCVCGQGLGLGSLRHQGQG